MIFLLNGCVALGLGSNIQSVKLRIAMVATYAVAFFCLGGEEYRLLCDDGN